METNPETSAKFPPTQLHLHTLLWQSNCFCSPQHDLSTKPASYENLAYFNWNYGKTANSEHLYLPERSHTLVSTDASCFWK